MNICLYQGTFNPPHLGHLEAAKFVLQTLLLDKIIFIPAGKPPHKTLAETKEEAVHRLNMTKLLVRGFKEFEVSDIEFQRETPSYTFITIQELYKKFNLKKPPFFIIGDDAFVKIESWYHSEELKKLINFVVLPRETYFEKEIFDNLAKKGYNYTRLDMKKIDISSSGIREMIINKQSLNGYTTKEIERYIYDNNLYQNKR